MSKSNPLKVYKLPFLKLDVDDRPSVANDDDLRVLVSLLNGNAGLGDSLLASIHSLRQPDYTVLLRYLQRSLQRVDGSSILVDLIDVAILEVSEHFVVDVFGRAIHVPKVPLLVQLVDVLVKALQ